MFGLFLSHLSRGISFGVLLLLFLPGLIGGFGCLDLLLLLLLFLLLLFGRLLLLLVFLGLLLLSLLLLLVL